MFKYLLILFLYPFGWMYGSILWIRNYLYQIQVFKSIQTPIPSIGIGNITVGGTGKTPHIEYFIRYFSGSKTIATLSRGYGRKTKGFLAVNNSMGPLQVGDEPWQFFLKFGNDIDVIVAEKRAPASEQIHVLYPKVDLLLMDDVYQHRAVAPDYLILLCDYSRPFFEDYPFPTGRLREFRSAAKRANTIIVSKCPHDMSVVERTFFKTQLKHYAPGIPVAFSIFAYSNVMAVNETVTKPLRWLLVTGIAHPQPLVQYLKSQDALLDHLEYADHHDFTLTESQDVVQAYKAIANKDTGILITEKDYARLSQETKELWRELPLFYIPITVQFMEGEKELLQNVQQAINRKAGFPIK